LTVLYSKKNIIDEFVQNAPIILDGAWGTQLQSYGLKSGECPDSWNITYPERVGDLAAQYIKAGSEIILTNTFRSNRSALQSYGLEHKIKEINQRGVQIAREASKGKAKIFASIGPCEKLFMESNYDSKELYEIYSEQINILANENIDGIVIETMMNLKEASSALRAVKDTNLPVVVSFTFNSGKDSDLTVSGETLELIAKELTLLGADVIGANCGAGIEHYISIVKRLQASSHLPLWIKPSAGIPKVVQKKLIYPTTIQIFTEYAYIISQMGVSFIGGCCGTTPEYIKSLSKKLKQKHKKTNRI